MPRRSNRISRENEASRRRNSAVPGSSHWRSTWPKAPMVRTRSGPPRGPGRRSGLAQPRVRSSRAARPSKPRGPSRILPRWHHRAGLDLRYLRQPLPRVGTVAAGGSGDLRRRAPVGAGVGAALDHRRGAGRGWAPGRRPRGRTGPARDRRRPAGGHRLRALLVTTAEGNLLWDPPGYLDELSVQAVADAGGLVPSPPATPTSTGRWPTGAASSTPRCCSARPTWAG